MGTLDTLSALNVPGCPKASGGLTRSLWAEMVFPDVLASSSCSELSIAVCGLGVLSGSGMGSSGS